jgi:hypothetical protein
MLRLSLVIFKNILIKTVKMITWPKNVEVIFEAVLMTKKKKGNPVTGPGGPIG